ncbi:MAG: hypothetical protein AAGL49_08770, partial [Pseudomonadota bacterium]
AKPKRLSPGKWPKQPGKPLFSLFTIKPCHTGSAAFAADRVSNGAGGESKHMSVVCDRRHAKLNIRKRVIMQRKTGVAGATVVILASMVWGSGQATENWYEACLAGIAEEERTDFSKEQIIETCSCMDQNMSEAQWKDIASAPDDNGRAGKVAAIQPDTLAVVEGCGY